MSEQVEYNKHEVVLFRPSKVDDTKFAVSIDYDINNSRYVIDTVAPDGKSVGFSRYEYSFPAALKIAADMCYRIGLYFPEVDS